MMRVEWRPRKMTRPRTRSVMGNRLEKGIVR
jgi:hypothetical protein